MIYCVNCDRTVTSEHRCGSLDGHKHSSHANMDNALTMTPRPPTKAGRFHQLAHHANCWHTPPRNTGWRE